ncbi:MAG: hypothetical protein ACQEVA_03060 [Myxococcota bacterium]
MQNLLIYGGGLLAISPAVSQLIWVLATSFQGSGEDAGAAAGMLLMVTAALSVIAVIAFAIHVWAGDNEYSSTGKVLWTLGMVFCFAPAIVPVYWYVTIFEPWLNKSNFDSYGKLGGSF